MLRIANAPMIMMPMTTSPNASQMLDFVAVHVLLASKLQVLFGTTEVIKLFTTMIPTRIMTIMKTSAKTTPPAAVLLLRSLRKGLIFVVSPPIDMSIVVYVRFPYMYGFKSIGFIEGLNI
jgi:hypothetical protein